MFDLIFGLLGLLSPQRQGDQLNLKKDADCAAHACTWSWASTEQDVTRGEPWTAECPSHGEWRGRRREAAFGTSSFFPTFPHLLSHTVPGGWWREGGMGGVLHKVLHRPGFVFPQGGWLQLPVTEGKTIVLKQSFSTVQAEWSVVFNKVPLMKKWPASGAFSAIQCLYF